MSFFPPIEYSEQIIEEIDMDPKEGRVYYTKVAKKRSIQRLTVDPPEPSQAKTPHAMPVFALGE